ncbi:MAG: DNA primase [Armatimonadota bacterium]
MDIVEEIKLRTDLVELISATVTLKRSGSRYKGLCPFHQEKTPSFTVDGERGLFKCFGCGTGGDCFKFVQLRDGLSFNEAGEFLARRAGLQWTRRGESPEQRSQRERLYDVTALAERFFRKSLETAPVARAYLERRGLSAETVEELRIGYAPAGYSALLGWLKREGVSLEDAETADVLLRNEQGYRDRFVDRLMFPICDVEGRPIAFGGRTLRPDGIPKYLNSRETPIFQKSRTLYGLHLAKRVIPESGFAVVVEGYMDFIALYQAGIVNCVAGLGTAFTETNVGILRRYTSELVMCYDGDSAGMQAALKNSALFEQAGCNVRVAGMPEGEDPDTYLQKHGPEGFRALLNRAQPLLDYHLNAVRQRYNLTDETERLGFVREAARVIAQSNSHLVRQEYAGKLTRLMDGLAEEWYPGDPGRAMQARVALSQEVSRLVRADRLAGASRAPRGDRGQNGGGRGYTRVTAAAGAPEGAAVPPSALREQQRYVLRAALTEAYWADRAAETLSEVHFPDPEVAGLASMLFGEAGAQIAPTSGERAERLRTDPASAEAVSELLIQEAPVSDEGLEECIVALDRAWRERRRTELRRAWESDELPAGDARLEELRRLNQELGGRRRRED